MNAPLSLFLTQFSAPPLSVGVPTAFPDTRITLTHEELEARLEAAVTEARSDAEKRFNAEIESLTAEHQATLAESLAAARSEWTTMEAERIASQLTGAINELREALADRLSTVLRPFISDSLITRTKQELSDALDRLLVSPARPAISVSGPADLIVELQKGRTASGIDWVVSETCEVVMIADAAHVETLMAAALAEIAGMEQ